jgi:hypothetical protein
MHDQSLAAIEVNEKILRPSAQACDLTAFQSRDEISWKRDPQVSTAKVDSYKPSSCENWNESLPNGFDFRKFRHKRSTAPRCDSVQIVLIRGIREICGHSPIGC